MFLSRTTKQAPLSPDTHNTHTHTMRFAHLFERRLPFIHAHTRTHTPFSYIRPSLCYPSSPCPSYRSPLFETGQLTSGREKMERNEDACLLVWPFRRVCVHASSCARMAGTNRHKDCKSCKREIIQTEICHLEKNNKKKKKKRRSRGTEMEPLHRIR